MSRAALVSSSSSAGSRTLQNIDSMSQAQQQLVSPRVTRPSPSARRSRVSISSMSTSKKQRSSMQSGLHYLGNCLASPWTWTTGIFVLSVVDATAKWLNVLGLADDSLHYGLVLGPIASNMWNMQLTFTTLATLLYVPEAVNTLSAYSGGKTKAPLDYEMIIMFTLTHTPLSIINFATSKSRNSYETGTQFTAGIIRVIYMFARILWHAQIEGNKMYKKMENQVTNVLIFLLVCLVFAVSSAFPIMSWMTNIGGVDRCNILQTSAANPVLKTSSVGIYLLQTPYPSDGNLPDPFLTMADPFLNITADGDRVVPSIPSPLSRNVATIVGDPLGKVERLDCKNRVKPINHSLAEECADAEYLRFLFFYDAKQSEPCGGLRYNFARIYPDLDNPRNTRCEPVGYPLTNGWNLFYLRLQHHTTLRPPWFDITNTAPIPKYDSSLIICIKD